MPLTHAGIVYQPPGQGSLVYLPLEEVKVRAWVADVSARIILSQTFSNPSEQPTARAKYVFPLPASAAACAFNLELEDGTVVVGEVKEKEEAASAFARATEEGKTAALVERVTDDIFTISVGSIPAMTKVTAHLTFVMDLLDEAVRDHVRLQLPMSIAQRYGTPPPALNDASSASSRTRVHITVDVQMNDVIRAIRSPTHTISLQRYKSRSGRKSERRMSAVWKSNEFLASDFVVTIHAEGLDKPRCFAEALSTSDDAGGENHTVAMQLTLVPKFQSPKIPSQEFIFVIDRSGSMDGESIETAKRTLTMLLRLLPASQTTFNIFGFGSRVEYLWPRSRGLDQTSLAEATLHIRGMEADFGGTEIPMALQSAFRSRGLDRPTAVFLLTDGRVNRDIALDPIRTALGSSPPQSPLRLFVLGIGTVVSSDICSSLAREGNGEYLFALSAEEISGKCARLLNAGRSKTIEQIVIDWSHGESSVLDGRVPSLSAPALPTGIPTLAPAPPVQQAPHSLKTIFSGIRFIVFAITSRRTIPTSIKLITKLQDTPEPLELIVEVTKVKPFRGAYEDSVVPMIHTLAARKLIMELDDGVGPLPAPAPDDALLVSEDELRRAGIIRFGLTYQLVSKHTSFVAIQKGTEQPRSARYGRTDIAGARSRLGRHQTQVVTQQSKNEGVPDPEPTVLASFVDGVSSILASVFNFFGDPPPTTRASLPRPHRRAHLPGAYAPSDSGESEESSTRGRRDNSSSRRRRSLSSHHSTVTDTLSTLSSLDGSSGSSVWSSSRSPSPPTRVQDPIQRAPSPEFVREPNVHGSGGGVHSQTAGGSTSANQTNSRRRGPVSPDVYELITQMDAENSFASSPLLTRLVGDVVLQKGDELGIDGRVWATVVAAAYLKKHLQDEPDLLELLTEKARELVEVLGRDGGRQFDEMVWEASVALGV